MQERDAGGSDGGGDGGGGDRTGGAARGGKSEVSIAAIECAAERGDLGKSEEVGIAGETAGDGACGCSELAVSHAFHSPQMEPMVEEFARRRSGIGYGAGG